MTIALAFFLLYLCHMFIKTADKKDAHTGKIYRYHKLCESYRIGNKTRHRTILVLGKLEDIQSDREKKMLADCIERYLGENGELFPADVPAHVEKLARHFTAQIQHKGFNKPGLQAGPVHDYVHNDTDFQHVDLSSVEMEDVREVGVEWLCKQVVEELRLGDFLRGLDWSEFQVETALIHLISRACYPASEHKTARWINENSAVCELFNRSPGGINRFGLYRAAQMLYQEKEGIEKHLSVRSNELFDLQDKIILYDLTNMYFEGRKAGSEIARFGKSKEKRSDAKLVSLALVVNREGFVKYSRICRGNIADCKTLEETLEDLSRGTSQTGRKPIVVIDAGIATEDNLALLKSKGYEYVCVSRSTLKDYKLSTEGVVHLEDKRENPIDVCWVEGEDREDHYLHVHSQMKAVKESSMSDHFCDRFEEELDHVARAIHKKGGTKKYGKVMERIGRIKERYPAANKHYEIEVTPKDGLAVAVSWKRKALEAPSGEGEYFLRTCIGQQDEKLVWEIYNTIRYIEEVFRVLKTDLSIRPIFHKKDENTIAHLFLGILAYSIVNMVRYRLKKHGIHHDWRNIVRIMNTQKTGTITMNRKDSKKVHLRLCSKPTPGAQEIYTAMGYKMMPFHRKKFVFPES